MGRIIEFIQKEGHGKYLCYKTRKTSLDTETSDTLSYDDKPSVQISGSQIAESNKSRVHTVAIPQKLIKACTTQIFRFFLDGSRHTYKIDDIAIGKRIFPFLAGQIIVGCCERKNRDTFKKVAIYHKLVLSLPVDFNVDDDDNYCRLFLEKINSQISQLPFVASSGIHFDDILLYETDTLSHFTSYISSDFGDIDANIGKMNRLGMNYVKARVICNTENIYTPVLDSHQSLRADRRYS